MARDMKRVNFNFPVDFLDRVDEYAERMNINRTSAIIILANTALDNQKVVNTLEDFLKMYKEQTEAL